MSADQAVPPSGVVTFLFTDVEGSTRRWEADADEMRAALAAHDVLLRNAIVNCIQLSRGPAGRCAVSMGISARSRSVNW